MEISIAYQQLLSQNAKYSYLQSSGKVVYNNGWIWLVVFESLNKNNYAAVKFYNGTYTIVEV